MGTPLPPTVVARLEAVKDDPVAVRAVGVEIATEVGQRMLDEGAPGIHFITMNRSTATLEVFQNWTSEAHHGWGGGDRRGRDADVRCRRRGADGAAALVGRPEDDLPDGLDWLSPRERARLDGVRFTKRRTEYLLRRWVGKRPWRPGSAGVPTDASLARIELLNHVTGAPYVCIDGVVVPWEISLSDRAGCAVALIGASSDGPDVSPRRSGSTSRSSSRAAKGS